MSNTRVRHRHDQKTRARSQCCSKDLSEESHVASSTSVLLERCIHAIRAGIADRAPDCLVPGCSESYASDTTNTPCMHVRECPGGSQACRQEWPCRVFPRLPDIYGEMMWSLRRTAAGKAFKATLRLRLKDIGID